MVKAKYSQSPESERLSELIDNDDKKLNWFVMVIAETRLVACFQCRTPELADEAARLTKKIRAQKSLPTLRATRRQLLGRKGRELLFGPTVEISLTA